MASSRPCGTWAAVLTDLYCKQQYVMLPEQQCYSGRLWQHHPCLEHCMSGIWFAGFCLAPDVILRSCVELHSMLPDLCCGSCYCSVVGQASADGAQTPIIYRFLTQLLLWPIESSFVRLWLWWTWSPEGPFRARDQADTGWIGVTACRKIIAAF